MSLWQGRIFELVWGNSRFTGIYPKLSERLLPDEGAQAAQNCWLTKGYPVPVPAMPNLTGRGTFQLTHKSIYKFDGEGNSQRWFAWAEDVFMVPAPITDDTQRRVIWTGDGKPKHIATTFMSTFTPPSKPPGARDLGVQVPAAAPTVTLGAAPANEDDDAVAEHHAWVFTYLTDLEEEGPPSPPSTVLTRKFDTDGSIQPVTITMPTSVTGATGINRKRIYRTATGTTDSSYQLLAEIPLATATYEDTTLTGSLGDTLISTFWDPPPANLDGLIALPNGVLAGFEGRDVYFSEPYQPHAWPRDYVQTLDFDIVGLGNFSTNVVVGTKGKPYIISGAHPDGASVARLELNQACASKHGFAEIDQMGVCFASTEGLVLVSPGGTQMISEKYFDKAAWQELEPEDMKAFYHDGSWVGYTDDKMIALNPNQDGVIEITHEGIRAHYRDPDDDTVYLLGDNDSRFTQGNVFLHEFQTEPQASPITARGMVWRSRLHIGRLRTFSAAQIVADDYPVTFILYGDNNEVFNGSVSGREPFRLPSTGIYSEWYYEISGSNAVRQVLIGTMAEMLGS